MKINFLTPALTAMLGLALASVPFTVQAQTTTNSASSTTPTTTSAPIASAPTSPAAPAKTKKPKSKNTQYSGTITAIDATSVTYANTKETVTLAIDAKTKFKKDKVSATLADFAVGDKITGSYTVDATGNKTAASIHKKSPKTSTPAATTAPATTATPAASTNAAPAAQ